MNTNLLAQQSSAAHADALYLTIEASPTRCAYGQTIAWRDWGGGEHSVSANYFTTQREARKCALRFAVRSGYTYPKWWQFWRWSEPRISLDFSLTEPTKHPSHQNNNTEERR